MDRLLEQKDIMWTKHVVWKIWLRENVIESLMDHEKGVVEGEEFSVSMKDLKNIR